MATQPHVLAGEADWVSAWEANLEQSDHEEEAKVVSASIETSHMLDSAEHPS
jgi:hypothetical protein